MWQFVKTRYFWISLAIMAGIVLVLIGVLILSLRWLTNHGETTEVPDVRKLHFKAATALLAQSGLSAEISDSVYDGNKKPLEVLKQVPAQGMKVKPGRTIYLTVNPANPPKVKMPDLKDISLRQAQLILTNLGLVPGRIIYKQDIAKNAVLDVQIDGKPVEVGKEISHGTVVDMVVGSDVVDENVPVPDMLGNLFPDAHTILKNAALNIGSLVLDKNVRKDTDNAYVYKQSPEFFTTRNNVLKPGSAVDLFLTKDTAKLRRALRKHMEADEKRTRKLDPNSNDKDPEVKDADKQTE